MKAARRIAAAAYPPYWYLDEHGRPFKFIFASTFALICEDIASGRADVTVSTARDFERWNKEYDAHGTAKDPRRGADFLAHGRGCRKAVPPFFACACSRRV